MQANQSCTGFGVTAEPPLPTSCLSVLQFLQRVARAHGEPVTTTNYKLVAWLLTRYDLYFLPLANPDGRQLLEQVQWRAEGW